MNKPTTTIDDIMFPGHAQETERQMLDYNIAVIDDMLARLSGTPATRKYQPPYTVVGFKSGYLSELAAIHAAKAEGSRVEDANGLTVWAPRGAK